MKRIWFVLTVAMLFSLAGVNAQASVILVTDKNNITPNGQIDWGVLGVAFTPVAQPFTTPVPGIPGLSITASKPSNPFERRDQSTGGWAGNFGPGDRLLWNQGVGTPMTFVFSTPVTGVGFQIQQDIYGPFTATISAFDSANNLLGTFTEAGNSTANGDNTAIFIGVLDNTGAHSIAKITVSTTLESFAINGPRVEYAVPEPATLTLFGIGGVVLGGLGWMRRRRA